jgi:NADH-quinone oxidoreductase subunit L
LGVHGYSAGLMHMATHAAFKALLFLAAGSIIHAVHTNEVWKMGSLSKQMALTFTVFLFGALALAAIPPFAGFFSKDKILESIYLAHQTPLLVLAYTVSGLTAFYVFRMVALIFLGEPRERDRFAHAHESPWGMAIPMLILAFFALVFGWILSRPEIFTLFFASPLGPVAETLTAPPWVMYVAIAVAASGMGLGLYVYTGNLERVESLAQTFRPIHQFLVHQAYMDELYEAVFLKPVRMLANALDWWDRQIIDRVFVDGFKTVADVLLSRHTAQETAASEERSGRIQNYLMMVTLAALVLLLWSSR